MSIKQKQKNIDLGPKNNICYERNSRQLKSTLFSKGKKTEAFFTEDSKLYITPKEFELMRRGVKLNRRAHGWDCLSSRIVSDFERYNPGLASKMSEALERKYEEIKESATQVSQNILGQFSLVRLWNISIVGAILFGMVTMTFFYRYLGQGASARETRAVVTEQQIESESMGTAPKVLATETTKVKPLKTDAEIKTDEKKQLEAKIREMVKGKPIEKMAPYIANYDKSVAAFIVAIARKESSWGVHVPVLEGQDCYNYWGYRGKRELMGTGGHTCFNSPKDAVDTVAKRIDYLVSNEDRDSGKKMVYVWKCGGRCDLTGGQAAADKWADDVESIRKKF